MRKKIYRIIFIKGKDYIITISSGLTINRNFLKYIIHNLISRIYNQSFSIINKESVIKN